ncbi:MAG: LysM peptidoglycan-binding domain-containing protein, partial [Planctomycetaceae bacterium]
PGAPLLRPHAMGRETKILLGLLGLLAGVFGGVLSMKLFVPRPPDGAGPDIHSSHEFVETQQVVEPPALAPRAWDFAAAPPLVSDHTATIAAVAPVAAEEPSPTATAARAPDQEPAPQPAVSDDLLGPQPEALTAEPPRSRFAVQPVAALEPAEPPPARDPFVARTAWEEPVAAVPLDAPPAAPAGPPVVAGSRHSVRPGDSWWSLAEQAYGDGRLYRALFAWNRVLDPRVALAPGTVLEIPSLPKLEAAWPKLMPPRMP